METPKVVFPGAFNPLHDGHRRMAQLARGRFGHDVLLEVSAFNVDKPALDYIEIAERRDGIDGEFDLTCTSAPAFSDKATLFPGATFIVGTDTLERIVNRATTTTVMNYETWRWNASPATVFAFSRSDARSTDALAASMTSTCRPGFETLARACRNPNSGSIFHRRRSDRRSLIEITRD
ncbi:MAG: hypothetical protein U5O39_16770 [Gammaproteobacteria bacterium]|nr:hypothetical protein [Gammaproteobacteria bacterium]